MRHPVQDSRSFGSCICAIGVVGMGRTWAEAQNPGRSASVLVLSWRFLSGFCDGCGRLGCRAATPALAIKAAACSRPRRPHLEAIGRVRRAGSSQSGCSSTLPGSAIQFRRAGSPNASCSPTRFSSAIHLRRTPATPSSAYDGHPTPGRSGRDHIRTTRDRGPIGHRSAIHYGPGT